MKVRNWLKFGLPTLIFTASLIVAALGLFASWRNTIRWTRLLLDKVYESVLDKMYHEQEKAMMIVDTLLNDDRIVEAFAKKDRNLLIQLVMRHHTFYSINYDLFQVHFHTPDLRSFLRTSDLSKFGDDLSGFRHDVKYVVENRVPIFSTGVGRMGAMLRYIAPVFHEGEFVGSVEANINIDTNFAKKLSGEALVKIFFNEKGERIDSVYKSRDELDDFTNVYNENRILSGQSEAFIRGKYIYVAVPVFDFERKVYACIFQRQDISDIVTIAQIIAAVQIFGSLVFSLLVALVGARIGTKIRDRISKVRSAIESL